MRMLRTNQSEARSVAPLAQDARVRLKTLAQMTNSTTRPSARIKAFQEKLLNCIQNQFNKHLQNPGKSKRIASCALADSFQQTMTGKLGFFKGYSGDLALVHGRIVELVICARAFSKVLPNMVFPQILGEKLVHAHASYPGLFLRGFWFNPYIGSAEKRVQGLDQSLKVLEIGFRSLKFLDFLLNVWRASRQ